LKLDIAHIFGSGTLTFANGAEVVAGTGEPGRVESHNTTVMAGTGASGGKAESEKVPVSGASNTSFAQIRCISGTERLIGTKMFIVAGSSSASTCVAKSQ